MKQKKIIPDRRDHGCDICHRDTPTQAFLGYCKDCLWVCRDCYNKISNGIEKQHKQDIWTYKEYSIGDK